MDPKLDELIQELRQACANYRARKERVADIKAEIARLQALLDEHALWEAYCIAGRNLRNYLAPSED